MKPRTSPHPVSRAVFADFATRREDMQANAAHNEAEDEAEAVQSDEAEGENRPDEAHTEAIERLEKLCQHLLTQYEEVAAQCQAACQERDDAVASEAMAEEICEQATAEAARLGVELSRLHRDSMEGAAREAVEQEAAEATGRSVACGSLQRSGRAQRSGRRRRRVSGRRQRSSGQRRRPRRCAMRSLRRRRSGSGRCASPLTWSKRSGR